MYRVVLCCIVTIVISEYAVAQQLPELEKPAYSFQLWGNNEGLPASSISAITTSSDGYLWFGTGEGLVRFDGDRFNVFNSSNTSEMTSKIFHSIIQGKDGFLWAANNREIIKIDGDEFQSTSYEERILGHDIFAIYQHDDHKLWLGSGGDGIIEFKNETFKSYTITDGLSGNFVEDIIEDHSGKIWIASRSGLDYYHDGTFSTDSRFPVLEEADCRQLLVDSENRLWVGTHHNGLYRLNLETGEVKNFNTDSGLSGNMIIALTEADDGVIWAGTNGNGLNRVDGDVIHTYTSRDGLPSNLIFSVYKSEDGIIWAGTAGAGLTQIRNNVISKFSADQGLSSNFVLPIFQEKSGAIWIGTGGEGLNKIENGDVTIYNNEQGLSHNLVFSVYGQDDGTVWAGTSNGLNRIRNGIIDTYFESDGLVHNSVHAIYQDSDKRLWIGTAGGGIQRFKNGSFEKIDLGDGYSDAVWSSIFEDSGQNIWVGSHGSGIVKISDHSVEFFHEDNGLPSDLVLDFHEDANKIIWIATRNGLVRHDGSDFETITTDDGLLFNDFFRILEDENNTFWTCSNQGVQFFSVNDIERYRAGEIESIPAHNLTRDDGMPGRECNGGVYPAGWKMQNGSMWFPTVAGAAVFNPSDITLESTPPPVKVESIISGDKTFSANREVVLDAGTRTFEIKYTALEFKNVDKVRFRYRLKNFDDQWVDAGLRRTAYFTGLAPGAYEFEVIASKDRGEWSSIPAKGSLIIEPHFYETELFYAIAIFALFFTGFGAQRIWRYKTDQSKLKKLVESKTEELVNEIEEHKATEDQLDKSLHEKTVLLREIHHRVKNNLAVISALFELQMNETENPEASNILIESQHRIKTIAMIHEHLYQTDLFSSLEMKDYIFKLVEILGKSFATPETDISIQLHIDEVHLNINQAIPCGLILNELVTNAYKHAFEELEVGEIEIMLTTRNNNIFLVVSDNGRGTDKDLNSVDSGSIGMVLIHTLVQQLRGSLEAENKNGMRFVIEFEKES